MSQYNISNVTQRLASNVTGNTPDETSFPYKLSLTYEKISNLWKAFVCNSSVNLNLSKTQISKIMQ